MYSTDKVNDIMKVPTCPAPAINLRMQKATYISGEAGSSAQAVPLPAKNRHPIAEKQSGMRFHGMEISKVFFHLDFT